MTDRRQRAILKAEQTEAPEAKCDGVGTPDLPALISFQRVRRSQR